MNEAICSARDGAGCPSCGGKGGQPMGRARQQLEQQLQDLTCVPGQGDTLPILILRAMLGAEIWSKLNHPGGREAKDGRAEGDNDQGKRLPGDGCDVGDR